MVSDSMTAVSDSCYRVTKKNAPLYGNIVFICRLIPLLTEKVGHFLGHPVVTAYRAGRRVVIGGLHSVIGGGSRTDPG